MGTAIDLVMNLAASAWAVLVSGLVMILGLAMLAHVIRSSVSIGLGSGEGLGRAAWGLVGPLLVGLFLFVGVPPLIRAMTHVSSCSGTLSDLTLWAQRLLGVLFAFRMLKAGYMAVFAQIVGTGEVAAMLLQEAAAVIAAMLIIPFISSVATGLLGC